MKKYLAMLFACAAVFACQNKEDLTPAPEEQKKFTGDEAYITIRLADVGSLNSKASFGNFQDADNSTYFKEGLVKSAHFYFYDADGYFVSEAAAWPGGANDTTDENIEFRSNNTVVLKGLEKKNYPKFMVTVLNKTDNFKPGNTLVEMEKAMSGANLQAVLNGSDAVENDNCLWNSIEKSGKYENYFVMSTSSWSSADRVVLNAEGTVADGKVPYFATLLKESDFKTEKIPADDINSMADPVVVYVERLAAKVTFGTTMSSDEVTLADGTGKKNMYPLKITLAGDDNDLSGSEGIENVYIDLTGWALNATARNSYMSKNINPEWKTDDTGLGFEWNDPTHFRSYWAKSFNYDDANALYHGENNEYNSSSNAFPLHYQTLEASNFASLNTPLYCPENTNTPAILNTKNGVTNVMLRARVYKETVAGNKIVTPMDMVRYNGVLYTNDRFINQLLTILNTKGNLNYYYCSAHDAATNDVTYTKLNKDFFELKADGAGVTTVIKDLTSWTWPVTGYEGIYTKVGSDYQKLSDVELTAAYSAMNTNLLSAARAGNAAGFKGGDMFYTIRIKHANNGTPPAGEVLEANYGVVRNHVYAINLTGIKKVGHAIFDEKVVTNIGGIGGPDEPESYYVGANVNVLSWKIVNQNVEL